ncbi:hypothetical protein, partial [Paraclostridium bifermentans]|uniref:hypothetical protein n=1 Tax=Paraclostridium bifermentans TaxID=1490 RepID=UPI002A4E2810
YMSYQKKNQKDIENDASQKALMSSKLDYISNAVDNIRIDFKELKIDVKNQDAKVNSMNERLIKVEESTKSAHHRLDTFEKIKGDVTNEK